MRSTRVDIEALGRGQEELSIRTAEKVRGGTIFRVNTDRDEAKIVKPRSLTPHSGSGQREWPNPAP